MHINEHNILGTVLGIGELYDLPIYLNRFKKSSFIKFGSINIGNNMNENYLTIGDVRLKESKLYDLPGKEFSQFTLKAVKGVRFDGMSTTLLGNMYSFSAKGETYKRNYSELLGIKEHIPEKGTTNDKNILVIGDLSIDFNKAYTLPETNYTPRMENCKFISLKVVSGDIILRFKKIDRHNVIPIPLSALKDLQEYKEKRWEDDLINGPILCWVWDTNISEKTVRAVREFTGEGYLTENHLFNACLNAKPLSREEINKLTYKGNL